MKDKITHYIDEIIKRKGGVENLYGIPTDIIGINTFSKELITALSSLISKKEICFFDENIKEYQGYHYLDFISMFKKSELMIFTTEIDENYLVNLEDLNPKVLITIDSGFKRTIKLFESAGFDKNLLIF